jgi:hypothetical protein
MSVNKHYWGSSTSTTQATPAAELPMGENGYEERREERPSYPIVHETFLRAGKD